MANVKSILEIEVNDAAFKRFQELFQAYSDELKEMPESWRALNAAMGDSGKELSAGALSAKDALAVAAAQAGIISEALRDAVKAQNDLGAATKTSAKGMGSLAKAAGEVGAAIEFVGGWIVKIAAFTGIGGLLGGFGFADLAASAMKQSRTAGEVGLTPGQYKSWVLNMQPFQGPEDVSAAERALTSLGSYGPLSVLFGKNAGANMQPGDLATKALIQTLKALQGVPRHMWAAQPAYQAYKALGFNESDVFYGMTRPGSIAQLQANLAQSHRDISKFEISSPTELAMENFTKNLQKAGASIETALINKLVPLAPILQNLTTDVSNAILAFIKSGDMTKTVNLLIEGLKKMDHFLTTVDWDKVGNEINALADKLGWLVKPVGQGPTSLVQNLEAAALAGLVGGPMGLAAYGSSVLGYNSKDILKKIGGMGQSTWEYLTGAKGKMAADAAKTVAMVAAGFGVEPLAALAAAGIETAGTFNPKLHYMDHYANGEPAGYSTGMFALNEHGEGAGRSLQDLMDPKINSEIAIGHAAAVLAEYKKNPNAVLSQFSKLARSGQSGLTHDQIMSLAGTWGEIWAVAQRPAKAYNYALSIDKRLGDMAGRIVKASAPAQAPRKRAPKKTSMILNVNNNTGSSFILSAHAAARA